MDQGKLRAPARTSELAKIAKESPGRLIDRIVARLGRCKMSRPCQLDQNKLCFFHKFFVHKIIFLLQEVYHLSLGLNFDLGYQPNKYGPTSIELDRILFEQPLLDRWYHGKGDNDSGYWVLDRLIEFYGQFIPFYWGELGMFTSLIYLEKYRGTAPGEQPALSEDAPERTKIVHRMIALSPNRPGGWIYVGDLTRLGFDYDTVYSVFRYLVETGYADHFDSHLKTVVSFKSGAVERLKKQENFLQRNSTQLSLEEC